MLLDHTAQIFLSSQTKFYYMTISWLYPLYVVVNVLLAIIICLVLSAYEVIIYSLWQSEAILSLKI